MAEAPLRLAENIILLQKLCDKPAAPARNATATDQGSDDGRQLDAKHEIEIVECLAYLSTYSNEPEDVMALCLEEHSDGRSCTISIATNTGSTGYLEKGLRNMAKVLEQAAESGSFIKR